MLSEQFTVVVTVAGITDINTLTIHAECNARRALNERVLSFSFGTRAVVVVCSCCRCLEDYNRCHFLLAILFLRVYIVRKPRYII